MRTLPHYCGSINLHLWTLDSFLGVLGRSGEDREHRRLSQYTPPLHRQILGTRRRVSSCLCSSSVFTLQVPRLTSSITIITGSLRPPVPRGPSVPHFFSTLYYSDEISFFLLSPVFPTHSLGNERPLESEARYRPSFKFSFFWQSALKRWARNQCISRSNRKQTLPKRNIVFYLNHNIKQS